MSEVKLLERFKSADEIRQAMKLAMPSTKALVQKGMKGYDEKTYNVKEGFPNSLMEYSWPGTRDFNMVLIFFGILNYAASYSSLASEKKDVFKNALKTNVSKGSANNILRCLVNPSQSNNKMKYTVDTQKLVTELGKNDGIFKQAIDEIYSNWNYNSKKKDQPLSVEEKTKKTDNLITKITERMKKITNWIINGPDVARAYVFVCEKWGANIDEDIFNLIKKASENGGETTKSQPAGGNGDHTGGGAPPPPPQGSWPLNISAEEEEAMLRWILLSVGSLKRSEGYKIDLETEGKRLPGLKPGKPSSKYEVIEKLVDPVIKTLKDKELFKMATHIVRKFEELTECSRDKTDQQKRKLLSDFLFNKKRILDNESNIQSTQKFFYDQMDSDKPYALKCLPLKLYVDILERMILYVKPPEMVP